MWHLLGPIAPYFDGSVGASGKFLEPHRSTDLLGFIYGKEGNDSIFGSNYQGIHYRDNLYGQRGSDTIFGARGADVLLGGEHRDFLYGEGAPDRLIGDFGDDHLDGGDGNDHLCDGPGTTLGGVLADGTPECFGYPWEGQLPPPGIKLTKVTSSGQRWSTCRWRSDDRNDPRDGQRPMTRSRLVTPRSAWADRPMRHAPAAVGHPRERTKPRFPRFVSAWSLQPGPQQRLDGRRPP